MIVPPWYKIAEGELGIEEIPGNEDNPRIVEYHRSVFDCDMHDEVAWCSAFANWCMIQAGFNPTHSALARSWLNWGIALRVPVPGAVMVFARGVQGWQGHVAFYVGEGRGGYKVIGGNQGNAVSYATYARGDLLGIRWPENYASIELHKMRAIMPTELPSYRTPWRYAWI
jgi:uncharacterized protein (TIGR02594 family)